MIGRTIGKYRVIGQLGRGGMGTVYKAIDRSLEREVAIKVLNPELADTQIIKRFRQEAITLAKLSHPEIATIHELVRSDGDLLMVMELVRGETLDSICRRLAPLPPEHAVYLVDKILSALGHAHAAGIVHCDMKPANVMVTRQGSVKVMDFGIARVRGADHTTPDAQMIGTPAYMPPEQALGRDVDARSDLYAVGIIFYRLLTGAVPFNAPTAISLVQQQIADTPAPLHAHREGLPDWCEPILQRALAKSPGDRFQTAEEFRDTLQAAAGHPKPEASHAFFGSIVEDEATDTPRPGMLERLGLTRIWEATLSPVSGTAARAAAATVVLPKRRPALTTVLLLIAVAAATTLGFATRRRSEAPAVASPRPVSDVPPAVAPAANASAPSPAVTTPAAPAMPPATPTAAPPAAPVAVPDLAPAGVPPAKPSRPTPPGRNGFPVAVPYAFDAMALVTSGNRASERASQVFLIDGMINVKASDDDRLLYTLPLDAVRSITYSQGRDPLWDGPAGPTPVAHGSMGLGIFRGARHWVALQTEAPEAPFVVLRLGNADRARSAITAIEQRTGRASVMLADDAK